jgi:hypothetical protein
MHACLVPIVAFALVVGTEGLLSQSPQFQKIERNHFDEIPTLPNVQAGDLDGDGDIDLLYHDFTTAKVYYNDGHAGFTSGETLQLNSLKGGVALADLDGDGAVEVLSRSIAGITVTKRMGGVFVETVVNAAILPYTESALLTIGDFDADGDLDVIESHAPMFQSPERPLYLENRNGSLVLDANAGPADTGVYYAAARGDIDGDGRLDFVAWKGNVVVVYRNLGHGNFEAPRQLYVGVYGNVNDSGAGRLWVDDLDGDGDLDLAVGIRVFILDAIIVLSNDGTGVFTSSIVSAGNAEGLAFVGITDVDQNGQRDLLVESTVGRLGSSNPDFNSSSSLGWRTMSAGALILGGRLAMESGSVLFSPAREYAVADLDGDLDEDVAGPFGKILLHVTGVTFGSAVVANPELIGQPLAAANARVDSFTALPGVGTLVARTDGVSDRLFMPAIPGGATAIDTAMMTGGLMLATAGQGLYVARSPYSSWETYSPVALTQAGSLATFPGTYGGFEAMVTCADFPSGLALLARNGTVVSVDSVASAALPAPRLVGHGYGRLLACDIEGDGAPDVIHSFRWLKRTAGGWVDEGDILPFAPSGVRDIVAFDYDGDGDQDLYIGRAGFDMLLEKTSAGFVDVTFGRIVPESGDCSAVSAGDIDGDGDIDLLVVGANGAPTRWLRNDGGTFSVSIANVPGPLRLDDIDGDGDADLLTANGYLRNTARQLSAPRLPMLGAPYRLRLYGGSSSIGVVFTGLRQSSTVPGVEGLLLVNPATLVTWGVALLHGPADFVVPIPVSPVLFGQQFASQGLMLEASGRAVFSNGIAEVVQ